jgi:glutamate N-acetyltransferase/amino-acid N-acetyltransferase
MSEPDQRNRPVRMPLPGSPAYMQFIRGSICAFDGKIIGTVIMDDLHVNGFLAAGVSTGIKKHQKRDLGLIFSSRPAAVAGVFTRNRIKAAPVILDQQRIRSGSVQAIVVNSGNANCCNGQQGMQAALAMTAAVGEQLAISAQQVLVASTGVIGEPLPIDKIVAAVPELVQACRPAGFADLAEAIMTTDTMPKIATAGAKIGGNRFRLLGIAKGAGMIRPDMATMLCFVVSDVSVAGEVLQKALTMAVNRSFNRITVDGDTSTNDTVLVMANGTSDAVLTEPAHVEVFQHCLDDVLLRLAKMCVKDGEGATKMVEIIVTGAPSNRDALAVTETVAHSPLVKTALFGQDANWGRILAAAGRAGVDLDPDAVNVFLGDVQVVKNGTGCGKEAEALATRVLQASEFAVRIDLNMGSGRASMLTCDFSVDYVKINADYRT